MLTVGAADTRADRVQVASFSGSGVVAGLAKPDLVGSGVGVLSVLPPDSAIARANPGAQHGALWRGSGTSESKKPAAITKHKTETTIDRICGEKASPPAA